MPKTAPLLDTKTPQDGDAPVNGNGELSPYDGFLESNAFILVHSIGIVFGIRFEEEFGRVIQEDADFPSTRITRRLADAEEVARDLLGIDEEDFERRSEVARILQRGMLKGAREVREHRGRG